MEPIRASFTGRNTVNQPLRTRDINSFNKIPVKAVFGDDPAVVQPLQQSINDAQDPLQLQESLDIALMQMKQHEEESDAQQLRNRVAHTAEFLASNRVVIDSIKSGLLEQREGELDVASTGGLEGTLLLDARKQQLMEREVLEGLRATQREHAEEAAKIETEIKGTQQQHEKTLEALEWQHASFFTQLQELQDKQTAIVRREELTENELHEDRADILVMKAQHEVHREHLASQEVEMFRIDTTQRIGESVSAQEFGRLNEQFANLASAIADFEESQDWQCDQVRNTETTVGRLSETTDRTTSCMKTLLAAAENIGRGHNMITTLARQQDIVEMQQRVKVMSDLKLDFQQNDAAMDRLIRQYDRVSERTELVNDRLNELEEAVKVAYEVLNRQEDKLNLERERAQVKEISLAKSAGHAILLLREAIVEARTILEQSETDIERLERVCLSLRRIARDFTAAMQQDIEIINDEIQRADDTLFNLTSKIEWFRMVSTQKNRQVALQQQQFLSQRNELPSVGPVELQEDFVEEDVPSVVLVDLADNGVSIACRVPRADDIQSTTQTERSRRQQLLDRAVAEQQVMVVEDEYDESEEDEEIEGGGSGEYIIMNVFTPEYYTSGLAQECA